MTRQIFAAEINFEDAPTHVREKFHSGENNVRTILADLRTRVEEVFVLATRQRFTVYVVHDDLRPLTDYFHRGNNLRGYVQYYYNSGESVTHLMATASGLLSPVKGEGNVLNDMCKCYEWAAAASCLGVTLDHTLTRAIETGRAVRMATGIDHFCASVVETGLELLYSRMENLHRKNFLIVGTGKLARLALEYLVKEGFKNIAITGYDFSQAGRLASKFSIKAVRMDAVAEYFFLADVIIGVSHQELNMDFLASDKNVRENKGCFVLDLGMPPNFDGQWVERYATEFYNLDDLRRLQPSPLESFGGLEMAWRMVMKASNDFVLLLKLLQHSPVLTAYLNRQFSLRNGEWKVKPKRTLRHLLQFRKNESDAGVSQAKEPINVKLHVNNLKAENGGEIVRNFSHIRKFHLFMSDN